MKSKLLFLAISLLLVSCDAEMPKEIVAADSTSIDSGLVIFKVDSDKIDSVKK